MTHFTSSNYLHIKSGTHNLAIRGTSDTDVAKQHAEWMAEIARLQKRCELLRAYLARETRQDPDALTL